MEGLQIWIFFVCTQCPHLYMKTNEEGVETSDFTCLYGFQEHSSVTLSQRLCFPPWTWLRGADVVAHVVMLAELPSNYIWKMPIICSLSQKKKKSLALHHTKLNWNHSINQCSHTIYIKSNISKLIYMHILDTEGVIHLLWHRNSRLRMIFQLLHTLIIGMVHARWTAWNQKALR